MHDYLQFVSNVLVVVDPGLGLRFGDLTDPSSLEEKLSRELPNTASIPTRHVPFFWLEEV